MQHSSKLYIVEPRVNHLYNTDLLDCYQKRLTMVPKAKR